ncbi:UvrB/UvrC motif-containing protein [Sporosarcina thermotolerans]|uniref:UvrB/UvrC motif-containing protein n=1 Tax=Sporosarcina thermotolerans TaxID=633404 RepID=A0AAW9A654_9BACL|nr:UvrB/UvrC motif-containing protein [Sporosarcina thermotolerans]MDW0116717.1 UvrB/UvrC motif-containing protein [Sporosarcina thermotolerans]WHT48908.1 UvrB/UvrC motif-containing protein [Sporosarcina thermotolerans]
MNCDNCNERPASVIFTQESVNGTTERHLCEKCAFQSQMFHFDPNQEPLSIQQFLSHWFGGNESVQPFQQSRESMPEGPTCPECELTFRKFLDIGKFGCPTCYDTFRERLPRVFGKLHNGHTKHAGKIPVSFNEMFAVKKKIEEIRIKMQEAIVEERFEDAAALRDEVNELKQHLAKDGTGGGESDVD